MHFYFDEMSLGVELRCPFALMQKEPKGCWKILLLWVDFYCLFNLAFNDASRIRRTSVRRNESFM